MKTQIFYSLTFIFVFSILIASCVKDDTMIPVSDDQPELISSRNQAVVPFKGTYTTDVQILGPPIQGWLSLDIQAEGNATHLGKSTWNGIQQSFIFSDPQIIICDSVTFIAANGDMLIGWYDGDGYGNPFSPEGVTFEGDVHITHGTNRFENVTGIIPYYGSAVIDPLNPGFGYGEITFYDGELEY